MAFNVNFRVLLFLLAVVMVLNLMQFMFTPKKAFKKPRYPTIAVIDLKAMNENPINLSSVANAKREDRPTVKSQGITPSLDNETCLNTDYSEDSPKLELCPHIPAGLGRENDSFVYDKDALTAKLLMGGFYKSPTCVARQQIAVIVPFSGTKKQMNYFLYHLHSVLIKQQAEYQVFVVEFGNKTASPDRGVLYNVGSVEALKQRIWQCLLLHEPHLITLDSRNLYRCGWYPRQVAVSISGMDQAKEAIGDVITLNPEQYLKANGFSNRISGKEAIYLDFYQRLQWSNYTVERSPPAIGTFRSFGSVSETPEAKLPTTESPLHLLDGLSSLSYHLDDTLYDNLCTHIRIRQYTLEQPNKATILDVFVDKIAQTAQST